MTWSFALQRLAADDGPGFVRTCCGPVVRAVVIDINIGLWQTEAKVAHYIDDGQRLVVAAYAGLGCGSAGRGMNGE